MALLESLKLPDILKASAAQAFALSVACGVFVYLAKSGLLPPLEPWMLLLAVFIGIFAGALWASLIIRDLWKMIGLVTHWNRWRNSRARRKAVTDYIPHMTEDERKIVGYLLANNQKSFDCAADGGHAATLLARGIIRNALRPGQVFDMEHVPMFVPDDVWNVLVAHKDSFPATNEEGHPWRVHWMAR
ncbi:super-infection exclusion protein B [Sphingomonas sp. LaA6.9]|uniref:super-infection exclusion protein B n=1 Tax=Sphingomonas sp. LaA6.9 TaxID=2919914 RepID=UPI001F4F57C4|nr:super-infection exclusion protein B [Sphingomonas sp. LaA6.9]MCJ8158646.1 superinfection exclusion B family protein [Sphingomonas sp. LaA6.9]